jgi:Undecaprenyl-phosphate galactose phosphotransferase WbaP
MEGNKTHSFKSPVIVSFILLIGDLLAVAVSFAISFIIRQELGMRLEIFIPMARGVDFYLSFWPIIALWPIIFWREGLYPGLWMTADEELKRSIQSTSLASLVVITLTFVTKTGEDFSRPILIGWWLLSLILVPFNRIGMKFTLSFSGQFGVPAVVLGANNVSAHILAGLRKQALLAFKPVAVFKAETEKVDSPFLGVPVEGPIASASDWAKGHGVDTAVVVRPDLSGSDLVSFTERLSGDFRRIIVIPDLIGLSTAETDVRDMEGILALEMRRNLLVWQSRAIKRAMDFVITLLGGILLLPLMLIIVLALAMERQKSIFFGHKRIGLRGGSFTAWKFRTMFFKADDILEKALEADPHLKAEWDAKQKLRNDPRLTGVGKILRRFSLDELPQLWNILKGEMSLVGPRPIVEDEILRYQDAIDLYKRVRPGLTGLWQVSGRSDLSYEERVRLDVYYVRNWSVWLDLVILYRTFLAVVSGRGAY